MHTAPLPDGMGRALFEVQTTDTNNMDTPTIETPKFHYFNQTLPDDDSDYPLLVLITDNKLDEYSEAYLMDYLRTQFIGRQKGNNTIQSKSLVTLTQESVGKLIIRPFKSSLPLPTYYNPHISGAQGS
jgi:hypothetical protein